MQIASFDLRSEVGRQADLLTAGGLRRFDEAAAAHVGNGTVPGLVALAARGDQVHAVAAGSLSIGGAPVRRDSLFRIASVTKPVTGVATLALAREGLLRLDDPVDGLLPELAGRRVLRRMDGPLEDTVPARRPVTVRDLLTFHLRLRLRGGDVQRGGALAGGGGRRRTAPVHHRAA